MKTPHAKLPRLLILVTILSTLIAFSVIAFDLFTGFLPWLLVIIGHTAAGCMIVCGALMVILSLPWRKRVILLLCLALVACGYERRVQAQDNGGTNNAIVGLVCGMVVIGVGIVVTIGLKKMCSRLNTLPPPPNDEPPPPPPWTGNTNIINPSLPPYYLTNGVLVTNIIQRPRMALRDDQGVKYYSASGTGWTSPDGSAVVALAKASLETAPSPSGPWEVCCWLSVYASASGAAVVYRDGSGQMICSQFAPVSGGTWGAVAPLPVEQGDQRFYRLREP